MRNSKVSVNRIAVLLLYLSILLFLALPTLNIGLIEIGSVNVYIYEIPLALSFLLAVLCFLQSKRILNKQAVAVVRIYAYTFSPLIFIGIIGALESQARIATILASTRPVLYWLSGLIIILVGHNNVKLKTLFWIVTSGLLVQFINGVIYTLFWPDDSLMSESRFIGRSGFLMLIVIAALFVEATKRVGRLSPLGKKEYYVLVGSVIILSVLVLLIQNRTTWIAIIMAIIFFTIKGVNVRFASRMLVTFIFVLVLFGVLSKSGLIPGEIVANIERRFFEDTISTQGHSEAWIGRSLIYESAYNDFVKRPILGSGFGHIMRIENIWAPDTWIDVSGTDNSFINIANKFGLLGLIIFFHFLYKIFSSLKSGLPFISKKDIVYFAAFTKAFPFLLLVALNIDVFYTYPEVIIFSVSAAKGLCMAGEKDMLNRVVAART